MLVDIHWRNFSNRRLSLSQMSRAKFTKALPWRENVSGVKNCSTTRKYSSQRSEILRFNLYFCHVYCQILLFVLQH